MQSSTGSWRKEMRHTVCGLALALTACGGDDSNSTCTVTPGLTTITCELMHTDCPAGSVEQAWSMEVKIPADEECGETQDTGTLPLDGGCENTCTTTITYERDAVNVFGRCDITCPNGGCYYTLSGHN